MLENRQIKKIILDNTSGSSDILTLLHKHIKKTYQNFLLFPELIDELQKKFLHFQNIQKYLKEFKQVIKRKNKLEIFFNKYDELLENIYDKIYHKCKDTLITYNSFITISNSKTVFEILKRLKKEISNINVIVCEARPLLEGRILAKNLSKNKINVQLITEAMMNEFVKKIDAAIIGADVILKNGNVVNKVGSATLAIVCKYHKVPFYVLADKSKYSNAIHFNKKIMPKEEIWKQPKKVKLTNFYFEEINKELITKIFTS
ncbi:MAG: translation initiation factor eIF-2B [Melioribacter sp.]|nr:translation initiation factor eIF-2B [Melioribacter sp.]